MIKAVLHHGVIVPLEPLPPEWQEGTSLEVAKIEESSIDIEEWARNMNNLCADSTREEEESLQRAIEEQRQQSKAQVRREMGLPE